MTEDWVIHTRPLKTPRDWVEAMAILSAPMAIVIILGLLMEHDQKQRQSRGR